MSATLAAGADAGKASPIGLLIIVLLLIASYFLFRSMSRHLRKVPPEFGPELTDTGIESRPPAADIRPPAADIRPPAADIRPPAVDVPPPGRARSATDSGTDAGTGAAGTDAEHPAP